MKWTWRRQEASGFAKGYAGHDAGHSGVDIVDKVDSSSSGQPEMLHQRIHKVRRLELRHAGLFH
jgi:hypothetical protein